jgi:hypothetical protein
MFKVEHSLPTSTKTFEQIIEGNGVYVDKTAYLASMISSGSSAWLFIRPRLYGKYLIVSTLKALFSGRKELFEGLAIQDRLNEECFAPRSVIHLDMSEVISNKGIKAFRKSLGRMTAERAKELDIEVPLNLYPSEILSTLIEECALKLGNQVAVLIDEYDTPYLDFLRSKPDELDAVRNSFTSYYRQLKSCDEYISFIFITGRTKFGFTNSYSCLNTYNDISNDVDFGSMTGLPRPK